MSLDIQSMSPEQAREILRQEGYDIPEPGVSPAQGMEEPLYTEIPSAGRNSQQVNQAPFLDIQSMSPEQAREELRKEGYHIPEPGHTLGERIGNFAHGIASDAGGFIDLIPEYANLQPAPNMAIPYDYDVDYEALERNPNMPLKEIFNKPDIVKPFAREALTKGVNAIGRGEFQPAKDDTAGQIYHGVGGILSPTIGSGYLKAGKFVKGVAPKVIAAGKHFLKETIPALGAIGAVKLTPSMTEEGTLGRTAEDIAKMIIGSKGARISANTAADITKLVAQGRFKEAALGKIAKGVTLGAKPNIEVLDLAEKHGIELPFNVGLESTPLNAVTNNYLNKTIFAANAYKKVLQNAGETMINAVRRKINTLGASELKPSESSKEFSLHIKDREKKAEEIADKLYDRARTKISTSDTVTPSNVEAFLNSDVIKELSGATSPDKSTLEVLRKIQEYARGWGIGRGGAQRTNIPLNERGLAMLSKQQAKEGSKKVSLQQLITDRKELLKTVKYDPDIKGTKNLLNGLIGAINKDIDSTANAEFLSRWRNANKFMKENIADIYRTDVARSLMNGEAPLEAISKMNSVDNIKFLRKIAGESTKGKEVFNSLAKAKARQLMEVAMEGDYNSGKLRTANFAKIFEKGEGKQEVIEELLGKSHYKDLEEISKVSRAFSDAGKELLNTSGTAGASSLLNNIEKASSAALALFFTLDPTPATKVIATGVAVPYLTTSLAANPIFTKQARMYAIARQQGKEAQARTLFNRMMSIANEEQKIVRHELVRNKDED